MAKYDFLIVGAGLFGATCARLLTDKGYKCLVMEKAKQVGGLCTTVRKNDIDVHMYGAHVFHTDDEDIWNFVNKYAKFNRYSHHVYTTIDNKMYSMPANLDTFNKLLGTQYPIEVANKIEDEIKHIKISYAKNFEETALMSVGTTVFNTLIRPFTEKMWKIKCNELPSALFDNMHPKYLYDSDYFRTKYEGIPEDGYTKMIENILGDDIDVLLGKNFLHDREKYALLAKTIIYTGPIDEFCNYIYGPLQWMTLKYVIRDESESTSNMFGVPVLNVPSKETELLQTIEHKWLTPYRQSDNFKHSTIISYVYPDIWDPDKYPMYPINNPESEELFNKYSNFIHEHFSGIIFAGRAGVYLPLSMDKTIQLAMNLCKDM